MEKKRLVEEFANIINIHKTYKLNLLEDLKNHVEKNMVYVKDIDVDLLSLFANLKSNEYLCFDTESCKDFKNNEHERVWCWSLSNTVNDKVVYGYSLDEFMSLMTKLYNYKQFRFDKKSKQKNINVKIWVHNLSWDMEFLKYWLVDHNFEYYSKLLYDDNTVEDEMIDGDSWNIVENNGQTYNSSINIKMPSLVFKNTHIKCFTKIKFYDSLKLIPQELKTIGEKIITVDDKFMKIGEEFDYEYIRPYDYVMSEIEKCYIHNDVYILKEFIKQYYINNGLIGYTASGIAFNNMLNFMFPDSNDKYAEFTKIYPEIKDRKVLSIIDKSYSGGYTCCNPMHKNKVVEKEGHGIDINSSYPSAMMYEKMPYGMPKFFKGKYVYDEVFDVALQRVHFDGFKRKNGSPIGFIQIGTCDNFIQDLKRYGIKNNAYVGSNFDEDGHLLTSNYNLVLTTFELELLESVYDFYTYRKIGNTVLKGKNNLVKKIEYVEGVKFKSKIGHLGNFIQDCVERKIKYNNEGNDCGKQVAKTDMNSVYGKLGSGYTRVIMTYNVDENGLFTYERKYVNENEFDYEERRKYYRAYASFTTSYGRCKLQRVIINVEKMYGAENFLYSDTDSCYLTLTVEQIKSLGVEIDKNKLGAWDLEKYFDKFKSIGAKKYILNGRDYKNKNGKMKIVPHVAGLPKESQSTLNFENFYVGRIFSKKQKKKVIGGYRLVWTTYELKEFTFYR